MRDETIPVGTCECGCGQPTKIATQDSPSMGVRKGEPRRFLRGHHRRNRTARDGHRRAWQEAGIGYGLCLCGCGESTPIASGTTVDGKQVRGEPVRYVNGGHGNRLGWRITIEDRGHETPCHVWQGFCNDDGYGMVSVGGRRLSSTHRVAYEREHGRVPDGLELDHLCRVRACCNPDHLEPVTHAENMRRGLTTKLTAAQVDEIRSAVGSQESIGKRYGITQRQVSNIKLGKAWRA
jgi:HNH endonuclease